MQCISYNKGYKYQLKEDCCEKDISIKPNAELNSPSDYITLTKEGDLTIKKGYAWDGPSGPTIDTLNFMRGSLVHDALYQLMRETLLSKNEHRDLADRLLQRMCKKDGMCSFRAWIVYIGLKYFGNPAADPSKKRPPTKAPKFCK